HVSANDARVNRTVLDIGGNVARSDDHDGGSAGRMFEHQTAAFGQRLLRNQSDPIKQIETGLKQLPFRKRNRQSIPGGAVHAASLTRRIFAPRPDSFSSRRSYP